MSAAGRQCQSSTAWTVFEKRVTFECGHGSLDNYCEATTPVEDIWEVLSTAIYMYMVEQGY